MMRLACFAVTSLVRSSADCLSATGARVQPGWRRAARRAQAYVVSWSTWEHHRFSTPRHCSGPSRSPLLACQAVLQPAAQVPARRGTSCLQGTVRGMRAFASRWRVA